MILWIQQRYTAATSAAASHSCVRSNSCICRLISFKFCTCLLFLTVLPPVFSVLQGQMSYFGLHSIFVPISELSGLAGMMLQASCTIQAQYCASLSHFLTNMDWQFMRAGKCFQASPCSNDQ